MRQIFRGQDLGDATARLHALKRVVLGRRRRFVLVGPGRDNKREGESNDQREGEGN
jgi:hypothetical protein